MDTINNIFFNKKPMLILLALNKKQTAKYGQAIAKSTNSTYSHVINLLNKFKKYELLTTKKEGRIVYAELTQKGKKMAELIEEIQKL